MTDREHDYQLGRLGILCATIFLVALMVCLTVYSSIDRVTPGIAIPHGTVTTVRPGK